jgi:hydroxymethylbilane synthase
LIFMKNSIRSSIYGTILMKHIRIGTRGSQLALHQAGIVSELLKLAIPGVVTELVVIKTKGDKILDVALSKIGDKGLFTRELEVALMQDEIDIAVHSLKDIPTRLPDGLHIGAVTQREDRRDALVAADGRKMHQLTPGDMIATSSLRRKASLLRYNSSLRVIDIRGNINTRISKMESGYCQAMVMAMAGLKRMGMEQHVSQILSPEEFMPAVSQGVLGLEVRIDHREINDILAKINHPPTWTEVSAERAFLRTLEGGCLVPAGCYTVLGKDKLSISGFISGTDGTDYLSDKMEGNSSHPEEPGIRLATKLLDRGGDRIMRQIRNT